MSNPFQKGNGSNPSPPSINPSTFSGKNTRSSQHSAPIDRSFSQHNIRREEQLAKKQQYRHFIDDQQSAANLMSKTAGRKMSIDTKRPVHRIWVGMMGLMSLYIGAKWAWSFSKPKFFTVLNLPSQGYSVSMMSPAELEFLGPIAPSRELRSGSSQLANDLSPEMKQRKAIFEELSLEEKDQLVPCYEFGSRFKQCMSYDQLHRKLDQCMLPLQQYNKCLIQHKIAPININSTPTTPEATTSTTSPTTKKFLEISTIASNTTQALTQPADLYFIPVEHNDYRY